MQNLGFVSRSNLDIFNLITNIKKERIQIILARVLTGNSYVQNVLDHSVLSNLLIIGYREYFPFTNSIE